MIGRPAPVRFSRVAAQWLSATLCVLVMTSTGMAEDEADLDLPQLLGEAPFAGGWDASSFLPWHFRLELGGGSFGLDRHLFSGEANHAGAPRGFEIQGSDVRAYGMRASVALGLMLNRYVSIGTHFSFAGGGITSPLPAEAEMAIDVDTVLVAEFGATVGLTIPLGKTLIRTEAILGGRRAELNVNTQFEGSSSSTRVAVWDGLVRAQVGFDYFVTPNGSLGLQVGYDPIHRELSGALRMSLHLRSYDGVYR